MPVSYCRFCGQAPAVTSEEECQFCYDRLMEGAKTLSRTKPFPVEEVPVKAGD